MAQRKPQTAATQLRLQEQPSDSSSYAVFDLETTGLDAGSCVIIEIGWCVVRDHAAGPVRSLLVQCDGVPLEIQRLTGITPLMLHEQGVPLDHALSTFLADTGGLPLVGHNVLRFDLRFVEAACRRAGLEPPARERYRDTAALYKARRLGLRPYAGQDHWSFAMQALDVRAPGLRFNLAEACREMTVDLLGVATHRAAGDVAITRELYARLTLT